MLITSSVRFAVLGQVRARRGDAEVDLGTPQQQLVLAVLLLRGGMPISAEGLVQTVWGEEAPRTATSTVRTYISRLRRTLGSSGAAIERSEGGYALRIPAEALDLDEFRQRVAFAHMARQRDDLIAASDALVAALALWHGMPLAGLPGGYAEAQRTTLAQVHLDALSDRIAIDLELGRCAEQVVELSVLVAENPFRERLRELYMLSLYGCGRQAEALATYRDIQRRLSDELGIDPGAGLRALHQRILVADPALTKQGAAEAAPVVDKRTPSQLPPPPTDFVGRQAEARELLDTLSRADEVPVVALTGMAGIGKTALALHVAHAISAEFPDGLIYAELGASDDRPTDPHDVLGGFLRAYGMPTAEIPHSYADRVAMLRTVLAGRRVLMLLDDARDSARVWDLLPATPGSAAIVTSRRRILDLPGSRWLKLDPLPAPDATQLLERLVGTGRVRSEDGASRLLADASYIPFAIHIAAARLLARRQWTIADVAGRIDKEVRAAGTPIDRGYRQLDTDQAHAFRVLAVSDDEYVSVPEAAASLQMPEHAAEEMLESLADLHLIEPGRRGCYRYIGLIKRFARFHAESRLCAGEPLRPRLRARPPFPPYDPTGSSGRLAGRTPMH